ncbi:hypothetical protein F5Y10DRAFT_290594 [Nemania abortiva]|nr:hypothetical protein F5Y10DRAFT_290594 [Nemania abortiva]
MGEQDLIHYPLVIFVIVLASILGLAIIFLAAIQCVAHTNVLDWANRRRKNRRDDVERGQVNVDSHAPAVTSRGSLEQTPQTSNPAPVAPPIENETKNEFEDISLSDSSDDVRTARKVRFTKIQSPPTDTQPETPIPTPTSTSTPTSGQETVQSPDILEYYTVRKVEVGPQAETPAAVAPAVAAQA